MIGTATTIEMTVVLPVMVLYVSGQIVYLSNVLIIIHDLQWCSSPDPGSANDKAQGLYGGSQVSYMYRWNINVMSRDAPCVMCPPTFWSLECLDL